MVNADGRNALYRNEIGSRMNWIGIRLLGTASNLKGIGAKVEVTSRDGVTRTLSLAGGSGYLGQNDTDVLFGLGAADRVDIRITWPNGVVQDFWDVWANTLGRVRESTMEGSCPLVFAWDGSDYSFVSDVMGSAVTRFALAPDVYRFPIDTDEYLKIEGLEPRGGSYSIRIVELLNEIIYLDKAILLVVDHPSDLTAFPNERLHLFPPFPKARTYLAGGLRPPVAALDQEGSDILYLTSAKDGVYFEPNAYLPYGGFAEEYSIVLDLGDLSNLEVILLVLNGWPHYVTSYGLHQASQAGVGPMLPRLDVVDEEGEWTPVAMDMGFPGGQVPNRRLQGQDHNEPATILGPDPRGVHSRGGDAEHHGAHGGGRGPALERIPEAAPGYRGPEDAARGARLGVVQADRDRRAVPEGRYTKYGDITLLLDVPDDMFVVMRHGDELALEFSADGLPELESGWSRSIVLYLDGYLKYVGHVRGPRFERGADAVPRHVQLPLPERRAAPALLERVEHEGSRTEPGFGLNLQPLSESPHIGPGFLNLRGRPPTRPIAFAASVHYHVLHDSYDLQEASRPCLSGGWKQHCRRWYSESSSWYGWRYRPGRVSPMPAAGYATCCEGSDAARVRRRQTPEQMPGLGRPTDS